jgi:16S rRNA (uracil1498-N3)-methyltransferase
VVQLKGDKESNKIRHWQKIAQHAAEQSGRTVMPKIEAKLTATFLSISAT